MQVIDLGGEPITTGQYTHLGRVTEFKYGAKIGGIFRKWNGEKLSYTKYVSFFQHVEILVSFFFCLFFYKIWRKKKSYSPLFVICASWKPFDRFT